MTNREWFKQAKFGMMVHWGFYALLAGEWKGRRMPFSGALEQSYFRIPNAEYGALASAFNPILFDADAWVQLAVDAGMRYLVVTSKHHDGFAMYHSRVDPFNIVDATPFKRDVIPDAFFGEELVETAATLNDTWGYKSFDQNWKPAEEVLRLKNHLNERGVNYLLNVGPDYLGRIPAPSMDILRQVGANG